MSGEVGDVWCKHGNQSVEGELGHPVAIAEGIGTNIVEFSHMFIPTHFLSAVWIFSLQLNKQRNRDAEEFQELFHSIRNFLMKLD